MRMPLPRALLVAGLLLGTATAGLPAAEGKRLAVNGTGHVEVRPDVMELSATVTANAELTSDALKKFRENRRRGVEAVNKLKVKGLETKGSGISILSNATIQQFQQNFGNAQQQMSPTHTTFSETITFMVPGIDRLSDEQTQELATKILDAAKDAGLSMGQSFDPYRRYYDYSTYRPQIVFFRVENADEARQKALDLAAQDARKKAERMAKRMGVTLGKAVSVREGSNRPGNVVQQYPGVRSNEPSKSEVSAALHGVTIEATLSVEYEILD